MREDLRLRSSLRMSAYMLIALLLAVASMVAAGPSCNTSTPWPPPQLQLPANFTSEPSYCVQLSDRIILHYSASADAVLFGVEADLPADVAYLGIGLSELGGMKGADMAIFNRSEPVATASNPYTPAVARSYLVDATGASGGSNTPNGGSSSSSSPSETGWQLVDSYAPGFVRPIADTHQDLRLLSISYTLNGTLSATWLRSLVPCDTTQDLPLALGKPVHFLWAFGNRWGYHNSNRGSKMVEFATPTAGNGANIMGSHADDQASPTGTSSEASSRVNRTVARLHSGNDSDADVRVLELTYPVSIPAEETSYTVHYFKLPDDRKYHILHYEPIGNSPLLHHGVAYSCSPSDVVKVEQLPSLGPFDRLKQGMLCENFFMMLATNMTGYDSPVNAALPFGANSTRYVALELHYNNPEGLTGQTDKGSGIRVYYTPKLRPNDIGLITLGQLVLNIPPGLPTVPANVSVCPAACTSRLKQPIQLQNGFFHMHALGKSTITRHYRGGRELTPLGELHAYDYAYQNNQPIYAPDTKVVLPGDILTMQCIYDSTSRTNLTQMGPGTRDEMCFFWISYWPAQEDIGICQSLGGSDMAVCGGDVKLDDVFAAFNDTSLMANMTASGVLLKFPGDPATNSTPYQAVCRASPPT